MVLTKNSFIVQKIISQIKTINIVLSENLFHKINKKRKSNCRISKSKNSSLSKIFTSGFQQIREKI